MQLASATLIASQLDLLAQKGTKIIRQTAMKSSRPKAAGNACLSLVTLPLLSLTLLFLVQLSVTTTLIVLVVGMVVIPFLTYLFTVLFAVLTTTPSRQQSLALLDNQLGLKDDLQIADQFLRISSPTSFEQAALANCSTSVKRATDLPLTPLSMRPSLPSKAQIAMSVLAILTAAGITLISNGLLQTVDNGNVNHSTAKSEETNTPLVRQEPIEDTQTPISDTPPSTTSSETPSSRASTTLSTQANALPDSTSTESAMGTSAVTDGNTAPHASAKNITANHNNPLSASTRSSSSTQLTKPSTTTSSKTTAPSGNGASSEAVDGSQPSSEQKKNSNTPSSFTTGSQQTGQQQPGSLAPTSRVAPKQAQRKSKQQDSGKNSGQRQSSGSQQDSNSQNRSTQGDGSQKKSRGVNQLMLSVPMQDQFIGTPGPGQQKSTPEQQPAEEQAFTEEPSQARGQNSQSATLHQKPIMQPWQKQMMSDFFSQQHQRSQQSEKTDEH